MEDVTVSIKIDDEELLPVYSSDLAAGADVRAAIKEEVVLEPGQRMLIPTGVFVEIPPGYEIQIRPRSGLAYKSGITVLNSPATIDADYRGEIKVILINHSVEPFTIVPKMRVAQILIATALRAKFTVVEQLAESVRGDQGFGSTGTH